VEEFVTQLANKSENNFMYLKYVLPDIKNGKYKDLSIESLPQGLQAYYEDHWRRMGMTDKERKRTKSKIVYVIAELRQPMPRRKLQSLLRRMLSQCRRYSTSGSSFYARSR
jgi:hypothetical protein